MTLDAMFRPALITSNRISTSNSSFGSEGLRFGQQQATTPIAPRPVGTQEQSKIDLNAGQPGSTRIDGMNRGLKLGVPFHATDSFVRSVSQPNGTLEARGANATETAPAERETTSQARPAPIADDAKPAPKEQSFWDWLREKFWGHMEKSGAKRLVDKGGDTQGETDSKEKAVNEAGK
jgi:hypothetical protein